MVLFDVLWATGMLSKTKMMTKHVCVSGDWLDIIARTSRSLCASIMHCIWRRSEALCIWQQSSCWTYGQVLRRRLVDLHNVTGCSWEVDMCFQKPSRAHIWSLISYLNDMHSSHESFSWLEFWVTDWPLLFWQKLQSEVSDQLNIYSLVPHDLCAMISELPKSQPSSVPLLIGEIISIRCISWISTDIHIEVLRGPPKGDRDGDFRSQYWINLLKCSLLFLQP